MPIRKAFEAFASLLDERLRSGVFTTEDALRYTFYYAAVREAGFNHTDIILEQPHPTIRGAEIDTVIRGDVTRPTIALEFKYDRGNPGGTNQNRTQRAAAALNDLFRLARVPASSAELKYFAYLTDKEMAAYFINPSNGLCDLYGVCGPHRVRLGAAQFQGASRTLSSGIADLAIDCQVAGVLSMELARDHSLRVFEVLAA
jgi:hypothetical protein